MNNQSFILIIGVLSIMLDIFLTILSIALVKSKIRPNQFVGYRTRLSLSSDEAWTWCNKTMALVFLAVSPYMTIASISLTILSLIYNLSYWIVVGLFLLPTALTLVTAVCIEIIGRRKFDIKK